MQLGGPANAVLENLVNHRWEAASRGFATHMDPRLRGDDEQKRQVLQLFYDTLLRGDDEQTRSTPSSKVGVALLEAA